LYLLPQRRNLLVEPGDLGLRYRFPLAIGAVELREIPGDALVNLRQPPLHLGLGEVPIPRVDGLELAAVDRNARIAEQLKASAQQHELTADLSDERVNDLPTYKREIGMMFQNYALFPHMTVAANVAYGLKARHVDKHEIGGRVGEALVLVKLTGMEERKPRQLSGGQQQRVALARALVINPTVLLLDEPFSALDKNLRGSMQVELREIQRKLGVTTIFVTHDQSEALSLSDRLAVMSEGQIRQLGTPTEIYRRPCDRFVASFVGDANVMRGRLEGIDGARVSVALGAVRASVPLGSLQGVAVSAPVELYVRPEHLEFTGPAGPCARRGTIVGQVYQGGHVDLLVECNESSPERLLVRSAGYQAMTRWPVGAQVGISISADEGVAFAIP
jgi:ABC-type Fe3+/spermidine/putrescine transport system ATPase subunit